MSTMKHAARASRAASAALVAAGANSVAGGELMMAAGEVIGKRVALGTVAVINPAVADHAEFAMMIPEKTKAFAAAGTILADRSVRLANYAAHVANNELTIAAKTCAAMAACQTPTSLMTMQAEYAASWIGRTMAYSLRLGAMTLQAQGAAMAPVHRAATANARRLRG